MKKVKRSIAKTKMGQWIKQLLRNSKVQQFNNSADYWETRYRERDNSGAGSYGRLAEFKAEILNDFVQNYNIKRVIEFGVGDGNQLSLAKYPHFIGLDVSPTAIKWCKERYSDDPSKEFYMMDEFKPEEFDADLSLSLDVIYHLVEDEVFESYMNDLFDASSMYVIIYSSNYNEQSVPHVRSRKFTDWIDHNRPKWELVKHIKNRYPFDANRPDDTSMADFFIYEQQ